MAGDAGAVCDRFDDGQRSAQCEAHGQPAGAGHALDQQQNRADAEEAPMTADCTMPMRSIESSATAATRRRARPVTMTARWSGWRAAPDVPRAEREQHDEHGLAEEVAQRRTMNAPAILGCANQNTLVTRSAARLASQA
jgi:hypothetical protein